MKLEISRQIFEKSSNIKFYANPYGGSRVVPCGQTDRHGEANSRFSQFCKRAQKQTQNIRAAGPLPDRRTPVICTGFPSPVSKNCAPDTQN